MLSPRGWSFLICLFVALGLALWFSAQVVALAAITLLIWFFATWVQFIIQIQLAQLSLAIDRELFDDRGPVASLWSGRMFVVRVVCCSQSFFPSPYIRVRDRVPLNVRRQAGETAVDGVVRRGKSLTIEYELYCPAAGTIRFEGVQLQFADVQGLFYHRTFLRSPRIFRVLPGLADARGMIPAVKRYNLLPLLGTHVHERPGTGSELLDLRDYIPGDPPKTIAWKVSARRDRLVTKEFESEVPIRCTLFVDTSDSVRIGPAGNNALAQLVTIAAGLTQAIAGARDLAGLCLFDGNGVGRYLRPARDHRHVIHVLHALAEAASLMPATAQLEVTSILPLAYSFVTEVYPDLLDKNFNHFPWWLPAWSPRPAATLRPTVARTRRQKWLPTFTSLASAISARMRQESARLSPTAHRHYAWRKRISALLAVHYELGVEGLSRLLEDDEHFVLFAQRFLADHQVPYAVPFYGLRGEYLFASPGKVQVLETALLRAVARAKDIELFVLMVDLLEMEDQIDGLLSAIRVARGRHHQVVVICPWPPDIALPDSGSALEKESSTAFDFARASQDLKGFVKRVTTYRLHSAFRRLRRRLTRMGIRVICTTPNDTIQIILEKLRRLRRLGQGLR